MFIVPEFSLLLILAVLGLVWTVVRVHRHAIWYFLGLTAGLGAVLWLVWGNSLSYTVSTSVNGQLAGSYEEDYRTWYKAFVTAEVAAVIAAVVVLLVGAIRRNERQTDTARPPTSQ